MSTPNHPDEPAGDGSAPRDAAYWAKNIRALEVGEVPLGAVNLNVRGRRLLGPMQGFGKLWQKVYAVDLGAGHAAADVIGAWKADFPRFWPKGSTFYGPLTGIAPGEVALLNVTMPGRLLLSTGVLVLYADDVSFTFMTPQGHMFASWITFGAAEHDGRTRVEVQVLLRASDPIYEVALALGAHRREDRFWRHTLRALAAHLGVEDAEVSTAVTCIDRRRQWARAGNLWHNAAIRSALYQAAAPLRWLARRLKRTRRWTRRT